VNIVNRSVVVELHYLKCSVIVDIAIILSLIAT